MTTVKERANQWIKAVAGRHLGRNIREYSWGGYYGLKSVSSMGFQIDLTPKEGKVVDQSDEVWLIKTTPKEFFMLGKAVCKPSLAVGSKVRVTPYSRRHFDGRRFTDRKVEVLESGVTIRTMAFGETRSALPVDITQIRCQELKDMIEVVETERADDMRTIAQVLIDAGALVEPMEAVDVPDEETIIEKPPTLRFRVASSKANGWLEIVYDRAMDCFDLVLRGLDGVELRRREPLFITPSGLSELGQAVIEMVDDGEWKFAQVEVLSPAKASKRGKKESVA